MKQPLNAAELRGLAKRVSAEDAAGGGRVHALVKPNNKADAEGMTDEQVVEFLVQNPNAVRRPIIDTGKQLTLGFTPKVRAALNDELGGG